MNESILLCKKTYYFLYIILNKLNIFLIFYKYKYKYSYKKYFQLKQIDSKMTTIFFWSLKESCEIVHPQCKKCRCKTIPLVHVSHP